MKKYIALLASLLLLSMTLLPLAYAEDAVSEGTGASEEKAVKTADDYEDLKVLPQELKEAFDFFVRAGVLDAESDTTYGVNKDITKEDFVKVIRCALSFPEGQTTAAPSLSGQLSKLGIINYDGVVLDPTDNVARQTLAQYLIYALGLENEARKIVDPLVDTSLNNYDDTNDIYRGFVTLALQKNLMTKLEDGYFHGGSSSDDKRYANRRMLVQAAYAARKLYAEMYAVPVKVSLLEAKAVGARKVAVSFDAAVSAGNAVLTVRKDGGAIAGTTEWSPDGKSATITLEQELTSGNYTVELSGLDEKNIGTKTAEFTAEDEKIEKLEFASDSDMLPRSKVVVQFKVLNQYGEEVKRPTSHYEIRIGRDIYPQYVGIDQAFMLDLSEVKRDKRISITVEDEEHNLRVNKIFTVGDRSMVSKIELGELKYDNGRTYLRPGDTAYLAFTAYDQYGYLVLDPELLNDGIVKTCDGRNYIFKNFYGDSVFTDIDSDNYPELALETDDDLVKDSATTVKLLAAGSGQSATKTIHVLAPKVPATVAFEDPPEMLAEGDVDQVITLKVKDAEGEALSAEEVAELAQAGKIKVRSSGDIKLGSLVDGEEGAIMLSGSNQGNIGVKEVKGNSGSATIEVKLVDNKQTATLDLSLKPKRVPTTIISETSSRMDVIAGKDKTVNFEIRDQYDEKITADSSEYMVEFKLERLSGEAGAFTTSTVALSDSSPTALKSLTSVSSVKFVANSSKKGTYRLTITPVQVDSDSNITHRLFSSSFIAESHTWAELDDDLDYYIDVQNSLFAYGKYFLDRNISRQKEDEEQKAGKTEADYIFQNKKDLAKQYTLRAIDKYGNEVSLTDTFTPIKSVTVLDDDIVAAQYTGVLSTSRVVGLNPGKTKAVFTFQTPGGLKTYETNMTVFTSDLVFDYFKVGKAKTTVKVSKSNLNGRYIWDSNLLNGLSVVDSEGIEFKNYTKGSTETLNLTPFMEQFGVNISLTDITYKSGTPEDQKDTFYMTSDYKLVFIPKKSNSINLESFKVVINGPIESKNTWCIFTVY